MDIVKNQLYRVDIPFGKHMVKSVDIVIDNGVLHANKFVEADSDHCVAVFDLDGKVMINFADGRKEPFICKEPPAIKPISTEDFFSKNANYDANDPKWKV